MGMYTIMTGSFTLKPETPERIWAALEWLDNFDSEKPALQLDHPLFRSQRHRHMLHFAGGSGPEEYTHRSRVDRVTRTFDVGFEIKDYDDEIEKLVDFISPWVESALNAYTKYEEFSYWTPIDLPCANVVDDGRKTQPNDDEFSDYPGMRWDGGWGLRNGYDLNLKTEEVRHNGPDTPPPNPRRIEHNKIKANRDKEKRARKARRKNRK